MSITDKCRITVIVEAFTEDEFGVEVPQPSAWTHRRTFTAPDVVDGKYHLPARLMTATRGWLSANCPDPMGGTR